VRENEKENGNGIGNVNVRRNVNEERKKNGIGIGEIRMIKRDGNGMMTGSEMIEREIEGMTREIGEIEDVTIGMIVEDNLIIKCVCF